MLDGVLKARVEAVLARVDLVSLVASAVPLSRGRNPRGKCPFHGSNSDSLAVYPDTRRVKCWGCGWSGDAIRFVQDQYGLAFIDALKQLESQNGLDGLTAAPVKREKRAQRPSGREPISSLEMGRVLWGEAHFDFDAITTFLRARGVPEAMLEDALFLAELRFHRNAPISAWVEGGRERVATAPAMLARVSALPTGQSDQAVHATFLSPDLKGKMERYDGRGQPLPSRKFLGSVGGGGVIFSPLALPLIASSEPLFCAEGIETLLSGMALVEAPPGSIGLALLSLDNLQGGWMGVGKRHAVPLFDPQPDPQRRPVCFAHGGMVVGLIDADMKPIPARVIERPGGLVVERKLSSAERSQLCAALFARHWRAAGCRRVQTLRPPMGRDFNDVAADRHATSFREANAPAGGPSHANRGPL